MNHFFRYLLLVAALLLLAQTLPAQDSLSVAPLTVTPLDAESPLDMPGANFYVSDNNFYAGPSFYDNFAPLNPGPIISADSYSGYASYSGSPASNSNVTAAQGDANFAPSQYMKYKKAVALGNQVLKDQNDPAAHPPLGDVARAAQAKAKAEASAPKQAAAPAAKHITFTQDSQGKMMACKGDLKSCS